jgi:hypothetical protein
MAGWRRSEQLSLEGISFAQSQHSGSAPVGDRSAHDLGTELAGVGIADGPHGGGDGHALHAFGFSRQPVRLRGQDLNSLSGATSAPSTVEGPRCAACPRNHKGRLENQVALSICTATWAAPRPVRSTAERYFGANSARRKERSG